MKLKKAEKYLTKINVLFDSLKEEEDLSTLEIDLMKEYLRKFYEFINKQDLTDDSGMIHIEIPEPSSEESLYKVGEINVKSIKKKKKNIAEKLMKERVNDDLHEDIPEKQADKPMAEVGMMMANAEKKETLNEEPAAQSTRRIEKTATEMVAPTKESLEANIESVELPSFELDVAELDATPAATESNLVSPPKESISTHRVSYHDELFESSPNSDLSDKLANTKIDDIRASMGLNERVLIINELFGGNALEFDRSLKTINRMTKFDELKSYLSEQLIEKYDWTSDAKIDKAKDFIQLMRRKFA